MPAQQLAKDPRTFDFPGHSGEAAERGLEHSFMDRIVETLREPGPGFAVAGRQVHFDGGDDFYLGLTFFHIRHLQFYIALVDGKLRRPPGRRLDARDFP
ncbi:PDDEXK nuclease domain-containing protein [Arthrobacter sp. 35W]|uniref:PDDEXK nuclease domain-containing protein n=1 Tax=Arthrobacter sp. 35W TaxID=1132441 RepID=UPI000415E94C